MKYNVGTLDLTARLTMAISGFFLYVMTGTTEQLVIIPGFVLISYLTLTGCVGYCPAYHFLGISTRKIRR
ncbi:MAG: DUF2892 domain-containing protein [Candidatus Margulisbacteria bacterium]|nr:DUF2892 domain-containing protein [Candidatus Margulisiibacteriota bacterium]